MKLLQILKEHKLPDADKNMFKKIVNNLKEDIRFIENKISDYEKTDDINLLDDSANLTDTIKKHSDQLLKLIKIFADDHYANK